jgi:hypothetical protein
MSDYEPSTWKSPTGDTIKIAVVLPFPPELCCGEGFWNNAAWAAHEINKKAASLLTAKRADRALQGRYDGQARPGQEDL